MNMLRRMTLDWLLCLAMFASSGAAAQATSSAPTREGSLALTQLIAVVAKKSGRKFLVDPRVQGDALIVGQDPATLSYADLLAILQVHGFAAVEAGSHVRIVPDANARQLPVPLATGNETHPDAEYVARIIPIKNLPAAMLVPLLRPLLPQQAHMVAVTCTNVLMIVDTFGNVKRLERLVQQLDVGEPYQPEKCVARAAVPAGEGGKAPGP